jgi:hypothetical protein
MSQQHCIDEIYVASSKSGATNSRNSHRLPGFLLKELAELIEENGGIQVLGANNLTLTSLLDSSNNKIFGKPGDNVRRTIGNKVQYWKKYHKSGNYDRKVLKLFNVQAYGSRHEDPDKLAFMKNILTKQRKTCASRSSIYHNCLRILLTLLQNQILIKSWNRSKSFLCQKSS